MKVNIFWKEWEFTWKKKMLKKIKNTFYAVAVFEILLTFIWKPATFLKLTPLYGCFSRFLSCTNATKSPNASHINIC